MIEEKPRVKVRYYDLGGIYRHYWFDRDHGATTIQHEIDHNNGILITDREVK